MWYNGNSAKSKSYITREGKIRHKGVIWVVIVQEHLRNIGYFRIGSRSKTPTLTL